MTRKTLWLRRIGLGLLALFVLIQLKQADRANPPVVADVGAPTEIDRILRRSCYDCHSHETHWPWYSYVAPVSWWTAGHVRVARAHLNFSDWPVDDPEEQRQARREIREEITAGEMPLPSYLILHRGARLSEQEQIVLLQWAAAR